MRHIGMRSLRTHRVAVRAVDVVSVGMIDVGVGNAVPVGVGVSGAGYVVMAGCGIGMEAAAAVVGMAAGVVVVRDIGVPGVHVRTPASGVVMPALVHVRAPASPGVVDVVYGDIGMGGAHYKGVGNVDAVSGGQDALGKLERTVVGFQGVCRGELAGLTGGYEFKRRGRGFLHFRSKLDLHGKDLFRSKPHKHDYRHQQGEQFGAPALQHRAWGGCKFQSLGGEEIKF